MCVREYRKKEIHPSMQLFLNLMKKYDARPNWGKISDLSKKEIEDLYPRICDFREIRNILDPNKMFGNKFLQDVFE
jgi:L-gulonolactone oxidase